MAMPNEEGPRRALNDELKLRHRHNDGQAAVLSKGGVWCTVGDCEWSYTGDTGDSLVDAIADHFNNEHRESSQ